MIANRLASDVLADDYFNQLYLKASRMFAHDLFLEPTEDVKMTNKELTDLLRFADLLSSSKNSKARNKAYQVITLLNSLYSGHPYFKTFAHSILAKLGNFPGINFIVNTHNNNSELPFDREVEKLVKEYVQAVPEGKGLIFTDAQYELYRELSGSKFFSFSGPTSMGKSFIIKSFIRKVLSNKPPENIVIMVPTRALINQFSIDLNQELRDCLTEYHYKVVTNSNVTESTAGAQQLYLLVLTPERLLSYLSQKGNPLFGYLFVDEAHKIAAKNDLRAVTAYNAISKSLQLNPNLNLYFASPNVSNPEVFLKLFHKNIKNSFNTIESPVAQNLFFINLLEKKLTHFIDDGVHYETHPAIVAEAGDVNDVLFSLGRNDFNIVYCSSRQQTVSRALSFYEHLQNDEFNITRNVRKVISLVKTYIHKDYYLVDFLNKKIAFHFGNLPQIIRTKVESLFKASEINYVFCTSTLLEGVNLPAKNIFILNDKIGSQKFEPIDFWNLSGRAGRLNKELAGNIFCVKENEKVWKSVALLEKRSEIRLNPLVENLIDKKLRKIEKLIQNEKDIKETDSLKQILQYIANIISIDTLEIEKSNYRSPLIRKLIDDNKEEIIALAKQANKSFEVPLEVLNNNQSIKLKVQNSVFSTLTAQKSQGLSIQFPTIVNYENCREWLSNFYEMFNWQEEEKSYFKNLSQVDYYAMLMNKWINDTSLSQIINDSIQYYSQYNKKIGVGFGDDGMVYEIFDRGNKKHVNVLIGDIIDNIEKVLRFVFEKYFNSYYSMLVSLLGEENAGVNWATFLEYGTRNSIIIALQNYGLSRHSANYIYKNHRSSLEVVDDKLLNINTSRLKIMLDKEDDEYDEIASILL